MMRDPSEQVREELARVQAIEAAPTQRRHLRRLVPWLAWLTLEETRPRSVTWISPGEVCRHTGLSVFQAGLVSSALKRLVGEEPGKRPIMVRETVESETGRMFLVERVGLTTINGGISLD